MRSPCWWRGWRGRWWALLPLAALGTFNRETIALLPLACLGYARDRRERTWCLLALVLALAGQLYLRAVWPQDHFTPCRDGLSQGWRLALANLNPVDGLWTLGFLGFLLPTWRRWPRHHWPLLALAGAYLALHIFCGNTAEVRLLLVPVCLVGVPAAFSGATDTPPDCQN